METKAISQFDSGYVFNRDEIKAALSPEYLAFLKEAEIVNLEKTHNLFVASHVLRRDESVENKVKAMEIRCDYTKDSSVVRISQPNARRLVYSLGGIVLPTGLMYRLFIPALKEAAGKGNKPAGETLRQMTDDYAEWLEGIVLNKTRLKRTLNNSNFSL